MWRERLIRFLLVGLGAVVVLGAVKTFADWRAKQPLVGEKLNLPELSIEEIRSEDVLGTARQAILGRKKQVDQVNQEDQETDSIAEPTEKVQKQTKDLIETIKQLPQDQVEAIKKQIYKEFCEQLLEK